MKVILALLLINLVGCAYKEAKPSACSETAQAKIKNYKNNLNTYLNNPANAELNLLSEQLDSKKISLNTFNKKASPLLLKTIADLKQIRVQQQQLRSEFPECFENQQNN